MKTYLLTQNGNFYKANLHCHSVISDGKWTVEQLKEAYMAQGYSAIAFTDHQIFLTHNDLTDDKFVALNGYEVDVSGGSTALGTRKTCHFCCVALDDKMEMQRIYYDAKHLTKNIEIARLDPAQSYREREYTPEYISALMQEARDNGFFVTYNHPTWSQESYPEYINYFGMHAMEMFNGSCLVLGYDEYNSRVYDDMLKSGKRIFCVGTDDNHNAPKNPDSFRAFTMINAKALTYDDITAALLRGDFYASEAPEIHELYYKNGKIHIECTPVREITVNCLTRRSCHILSENGEPITSADIGIPYDAGYFRVTVTDNAGCRATTNAYFLDELK